MSSNALAFSEPLGAEHLRRTSGAADLAEVWPESVLASSHQFGWRTLRAVQVRRVPGDADLPAFEHHCVVIHLGSEVEAEVRVGDAWHDGTIPCGAISIIPAGIPSLWRLRGPYEFEALFVFLPDLALVAAAEACDLGAVTVELDARIATKDPQLEHAMMSLLWELAEPNVIGRHYAEPYASLLASQLVKRYSVVGNIQIRRGGIAPRRLYRVLERVNTALDNEEAIDLNELAAAAGIGYFHFFKAFKQSMGTSPNQYLLERRVERAKALLAGTELPIAEIALRVGFASQSHFATMFRRLAGATPRVYRATA